MVSDNDLYGEDSEFDDEKTTYSRPVSIFETSVIESIPIVLPKKLNLEINKTLQKRKVL